MDITIDRLAGCRILQPLHMHASPGEKIDISWSVQEWVALKSMRVWRVPPGGLLPSIAPLVSLGGLFRLVGYSVGPRTWGAEELGGGIDVSAVSWSGLVAGPGCSVDLVLVARPELPADTPIMVTIAVEPPPPCFQPRAAA